MKEGQTFKATFKLGFCPSCVILGTLFNGLNLGIFEKGYDKFHLTGSESTHMGRLPSQGPPPLAFCVCLLSNQPRWSLQRRESDIFEIGRKGAVYND